MRWIIFLLLPLLLSASDSSKPPSSPSPPPNQHNPPSQNQEQGSSPDSPIDSDSGSETQLPLLGSPLSLSPLHRALLSQEIQKLKEKEQEQARQLQLLSDMKQTIQKGTRPHQENLSPSSTAEERSVFFFNQRGRSDQARRRSISPQPSTSRQPFGFPPFDPLPSDPQRPSTSSQPQLRFIIPSQGDPMQHILSILQRFESHPNSPGAPHVIIHGTSPPTSPSSGFQSRLSREEVEAEVERLFQLQTEEALKQSLKGIPGHLNQEQSQLQKAILQSIKLFQEQQLKTQRQLRQRLEQQKKEEQAQNKIRLEKEQQEKKKMEAELQARRQRHRQQHQKDRAGRTISPPSSPPSGEHSHPPHPPHSPSRTSSGTPPRIVSLNDIPHRPTRPAGSQRPKIGTMKQIWDRAPEKKEEEKEEKEELPPRRSSSGRVSPRLRTSRRQRQIQPPSPLQHQGSDKEQSEKQDQETKRQLLADRAKQRLDEQKAERERQRLRQIQEKKQKQQDDMASEREQLKKLLKMKKEKQEKNKGRKKVSYLLPPEDEEPLQVTLPPLPGEQDQQQQPEVYEIGAGY